MQVEEFGASRKEGEEIIWAPRGILSASLKRAERGGDEVVVCVLVISVDVFCSDTGKN